MSCGARKHDWQPTEDGGRKCSKCPAYMAPSQVAGLRKGQRREPAPAPEYDPPQSLAPDTGTVQTTVTPYREPAPKPAPETVPEPPTKTPANTEETEPAREPEPEPRQGIWAAFLDGFGIGD